MTYYYANVLMLSYILVFFKICWKKSKKANFGKLLDFFRGPQTGK